MLPLKVRVQNQIGSQLMQLGGQNNIVLSPKFDFLLNNVLGAGAALFLVFGTALRIPLFIACNVLGHPVKLGKNGVAG